MARVSSRPRLASFDALLEVAVTITAWDPAESAALPREEYPEHLIRELDLLHAAYQLRKWVLDLFFAMDLSRPGAIQMLGASITSGATSEETNAGVNYPVCDLTSRSTTLTWPTVRDLPLRDVTRWLERCPMWKEGFTADGVSRVVQALSHLKHEENAAVELLWITVGLESLFTTGEAGLLKQIRDGSQLLLGKDPSAHKLVNDLYRVRSKFLHGKLDFAGPHHFHDAMPEFSNFNATMDSAIHRGRRLLTRAVQELVARDWHEAQLRAHLGSM